MKLILSAIYSKVAAKVLAALLGVAGIISLVLIIVAGDDAIKSGEKAYIVDYISLIGYITLGLILFYVIVFILINLFTNTSGLKNTLIGLGAFAAVLIISYVLSDSDNPVMENGKSLFRYGDKVATGNEVQLSGAGLVAFYILMIVASLAMIFSGVKKVISK